MSCYVILYQLSHGENVRFHILMNLKKICSMMSGMVLAGMSNVKAALSMAEFLRKKYQTTKQLYQTNCRVKVPEPTWHMIPYKHQGSMKINLCLPPDGGTTASPSPRWRDSPSASHVSSASICSSATPDTCTPRGFRRSRTI